MKKLLNAFLCVILVMTLMPSAVFAETGSTEENLPGTLYFIYAGDNVTLGDNNQILINGTAYENTAEW